MPIFSSIEPQVTPFGAPSEPSSFDHELGHDEQRNALGAGRRAFDAREHQMHDVLGEVVLAGGNENFGAGDFVAAVGLRHRLGAQQAKIGAAMRLGQIHGAGPNALHHLWQILLLQLRRGMGEQRGDCALGEARIHGEGHIGRTQQFVTATVNVTGRS